jgi:outer membrane protein TolC
VTSPICASGGRYSTIRCRPVDYRRRCEQHRHQDRRPAVIEARAQLGIAQSGRYPQLQQIGASPLHRRSQSGGRNPLGITVPTGFDVGWELDFWGRFSRAIESADAAYFAAGANYEDVLVLLHAQIAETYMALRTTEAHLRIARENAALQKRSLDITELLFKSGNDSELDVQQAKAQYLGTLATIPQLEAAASNPQRGCNFARSPPGRLNN